MIFTKGKIQDAYILDIEKYEDERGFFGRAFCQKEFKEHGLDQNVVQANVSFSKQRGTLRGLHYQTRPYREAKLMRCTRGAIYDVIADVRSDSPTFKQWMGVELTADNYRMLYVPKGCAHGFITLEDDTEALYQVSAFYAPEHERGLRYDDPAFGIEWPIDVQVISDKDRQWPDFEEASAVV
jgi:dTDP-4-dehydrorhamnose 3,5-epimerase